MHLVLWRHTTKSFYYFGLMTLDPIDLKHPFALIGAPKWIKLTLICLKKRSILLLIGIVYSPGDQTC